MTPTATLMNNNISVGSHNARGLAGPGRLDLLMRDFMSTSYTILLVQEHNLSPQTNLKVIEKNMWVLHRIIVAFALVQMAPHYGGTMVMV